MRLIAVASFSLLVAAPAAAQVSFPRPGEPSAPQVTAWMTDDDRRILDEREERAAAVEVEGGEDGQRRMCRTVPHDTNSRVGRRRLCLTPRQWRERQ